LRVRIVFIYCSSAVIQHEESGFDDSMRVLLYMRVAEAVVGKAFAAANPTLHALRTGGAALLPYALRTVGNGSPVPG
jgi:hypothetical protein